MMPYFRDLGYINFMFMHSPKKLILLVVLIINFIIIVADLVLVIIIIIIIIDLMLLYWVENWISWIVHSIIVTPLEWLQTNQRVTNPGHLEWCTLLMGSFDGLLSCILCVTGINLSQMLYRKRTIQRVAKMIYCKLFPPCSCISFAFWQVSVHFSG